MAGCKGPLDGCFVHGSMATVLKGGFGFKSFLAGSLQLAMLGRLDDTECARWIGLN